MLLTPSQIIEYLFCPRFSYFEYVLNIPQHEENRHKVQRGRKIHEIRETMGQDYLRKRIGVVEKEVSMYLSSDKLGFKGIVDEVLQLSDGTMAPLDYKFAEYKDRIFKTYKMQTVIYALLIMENYQKEVNRAYLVYVRSKNKIVELKLEKKDFDMAINVRRELQKVISTGFYPKGTRYKRKCPDCTYSNICVK